MKQERITIVLMPWMLWAQFWPFGNLGSLLTSFPLVHFFLSLSLYLSLSVLLSWRVESRRPRWHFGGLHFSFPSPSLFLFLSSLLCLHQCFELNAQTAPVGCWYSSACPEPFCSVWLGEPCISTILFHEKNRYWNGCWDMKTI